MKRTGDTMNIKSFISMFLKEIEKSGLPIAEIEKIHTDKGLFGIRTSDKKNFLIKITERNALQESTLLEMDEMGHKLHEIYENYTDNWKYNELLMTEDFDIEWLIDKLDDENYQKLENYILEYTSRHDELLFHLGFKYAWVLFTECTQQESNIT